MAAHKPPAARVGINHNCTGSENLTAVRVLKGTQVPGGLQFPERMGAPLQRLFCSSPEGGDKEGSHLGGGGEEGWHHFPVVVASGLAEGEVNPLPARSRAIMLGSGGDLTQGTAPKGCSQPASFQGILFPSSPFLSSRTEARLRQEILGQGSLLGVRRKKINKSHKVRREKYADLVRQPELGYMLGNIPQP